MKTRGKRWNGLLRGLMHLNPSAARSLKDGQDSCMFQDSHLRQDDLSRS
jgi:hypothetical protein